MHGVAIFRSAITGTGNGTGGHRVPVANGARREIDVSCSEFDSLTIFRINESTADCMSNEIIALRNHCLVSFTRGVGVGVIEIFIVIFFLMKL